MAGDPGGVPRAVSDVRCIFQQQLTNCQLGSTGGQGVAGGDAAAASPCLVNQSRGLLAIDAAAHFGCPKRHDGHPVALFW